jgi:hypothetical protein
VAVLGKANYVKASEPRAWTFSIDGQRFDVGRVADVAMVLGQRLSQRVEPLLTLALLLGGTVHS